MDFDGYLASRQYATTTRELYTQYARRLDRFTTAATCTTDDLTEFLELLPRTAPSRRAARKALIVYMKYLGRDPNPAQALHSVPEPHRLPRPLTEEEHRRWITAARAMGGLHAVAGVMLATTGARQGELRVARWEDLSLGTPGTWRVRGKGARQAGPRWRQAHLHTVAVELLDATPRQGRWVFPGSEGHMTDKAMRAMLIEIGEHAGLGRITPHRIRHSVGTLALAHCGNLIAVQALLGHARPDTTAQYTALLPGRLEDLVEALPV